MSQADSTIKNRIICIGNQFDERDSCGPRVYELLQHAEMPDTTSLINGGLAGLNLLSLLEGVERVIFVDTVDGFSPNPAVCLIEDPAPHLEQGEYGHGAGLGFLLNAAPLVLEGPLPEILLVGVEHGNEEHFRKAADLCIRLVTLSDPER